MSKETPHTSDRPRLVNLKPGQIKIPDVRVTSSWEPELLGMFRESIKAMGIVEPVIVIQDHDDYWLVDGLHRLQEAQLNNSPKVGAVVLPGSLKDVHLKNLMLNRLRGRTKVSEMVMVIRELDQKFKMDIESIARETGLKRDYVEKMLSISKVHPDVLADLDEERIGVGHAYELSRLPDPDRQQALLPQIRLYKLKIEQVKEIVDEGLKIIKERESGGTSEPAPVPIPTSVIKCGWCKEMRPIAEVVGFNICRHCFTVGYGAVREILESKPPSTQQTGQEPS